MAQPQKKKEPRRTNNASQVKNVLGIKTNNADKEMEWLIMPQAYQEALKLPGIPVGYVSTIVGHSNTGKSTLVNHAIIAAQHRGDLPVIYDTENNFDFTYAIDMGMDATPVYEDVEVPYIDPETGEESTIIEHKIVNYEGNFIYFNSNMLAERYGKRDYMSGKELSKSRKMPVIEDIAYSMNEFMDAQDNGDIECGFVFIWDSVGSIGSYKGQVSKTNNAMWDANAISTAFSGILNTRIPISRKVTSDYTNTMIIINKIWLDSMTNPVAPPSIQLKGGATIFYATRLMILMGGQLKSSIKKLTATAKGASYTFGTQTKIKVLKNQLPSPFTITYEGEVVCTPNGMISTDKNAIEEYKKSHLKDILGKINEMVATFNDQTSLVQEIDEVEFGESEEFE